MTAFKPTRRELADVRRFARECEIEARAARYSEICGLPWVYVHDARARDYAGLAFRLSQRIAARAGQ